MKRRTHWGKRQNAQAQDDVVFCAKTGAPISSAPPPNVIPFPRAIVNSGAIEQNNDPAHINNDDI